MKLNGKLMEKGSILLLVGLITVILSGYTTGLQAEEIVIEDYEGVQVSVEAPVETIVCMTTSGNQILHALDSFDKVIGWDKNSRDGIFPAPEGEVQVVADNSHSPQIEAIAEMDPDIIIADTMLQDSHRRQLESFDIPVIVERTSDPERIYETIRNIGKLVGKSSQAEELVAFIDHYRSMIEERTADLPEDSRRRVYWEWYTAFKTGSDRASVHPTIVNSGGSNICAEADGRYPTVSAEYVWERNPEVIIKQASRGASRKEMKENYNQVVERESLRKTEAVQSGKVYVVTWDITNGLTSIVGDLYMSKWIQPEEYEDIDPEGVYAELMNKFFGVEEYQTWVYTEQD